MTEVEVVTNLLHLAPQKRSPTPVYRNSVLYRPDALHITQATAQILEGMAYTTITYTTTGTFGFCLTGLFTNALQIKTGRYIRVVKGDFKTDGSSNAYFIFHHVTDAGLCCISSTGLFV